MDLCQFSGSTRQIAACIVASLPVFMAGIVLGWPSPIMEYMSAGHAPVLLTTTQMSFMVACIDIGNFAMALPAGWLMDRMGRKFAVNMSAPLMFAGWLLILYGRQAWCLYAARLLQGTAVGIGWVVAPAYVGEMASVRIRGMLGLMVQLSYGLGLLFSYTVGWLLHDYVSLTVASGFVTVVSAVLFLFLPESPYYLVMAGRSDDAILCLRSLRNYSADELQSELVTVKNSVLNDRHEGTVHDLVTRDRRPLLIVIALAVLQMACGASVLEAYAASILSATNLVSANASAVILGLIILVAAVPFALAVDRWGRRPLMIVSCFGTAICHAGVAASLWHLNQPFSAAVGGWLPLFGCVAGAQFFINIGLMPLLSVVQCEYFPSDTRALADTAVVLTVTLTSTIVITVYRAAVTDFITYAALSFAGGIFCCVFMPETMRKSFAEIQMDFHQGMPLDTTNDKTKLDYEQI